jgi:hypothetical protein
MEKFGSGINIPDPQHFEDILLFHHLKIFSEWGVFTFVVA